MLLEPVPPTAVLSAAVFIVCIDISVRSVILLCFWPTIPRVHVRAAPVRARIFEYAYSRHKKHRARVRRAHMSTVAARKLGGKWAA